MAIKVFVTRVGNYLIKYELTCLIYCLTNLHKGSMNPETERDNFVERDPLDHWNDHLLGHQVEALF